MRIAKEEVQYKSFEPLSVYSPVKGKMAVEKMYGHSLKWKPERE